MYEIIDVISPIVIILAFSCKRLFQFQSFRGAEQGGQMYFLYDVNQQLHLSVAERSDRRK